MIGYRLGHHDWRQVSNLIVGEEFQNECRKRGVDSDEQVNTNEHNIGRA